MRPLPDSPLTVAYGGGVDSTAMLVGFVQRGIRWDLALFADPGSEWPETYAYLKTINAWVRERGLPEVVTVRYTPPIAPYSTLEGELMKNQTLPSLAFGRKSCSFKWKKVPQDAYKKSWEPAIASWARGEKIITAVGLDAGKADTRRACKYWGATKERDQWRGLSPDEEQIWHPLRDWGWDRDRCAAEIAKAGLPVPHKSACTFCPSAHEEEIAELAENHPHLFAKAILIEDRAVAGKHKIGTKSVKGLGRRWSWRSFAEKVGLIRRTA